MDILVQFYPMKYYVIAGEASGDLHGSNLIKYLKLKDRSAEVRCWGGDLMARAGAQVIKHYRDLAFMGFAEVVANLGTIINNIKVCKADITSFSPDVVVLIDYPGFNLRIAEWAKLKGYKIVYYISPQVWAWKQSRVKKIKRFVDRMIVILPFEKPFYDKWDYEVDYVGHPLTQVVEDFRNSNENSLPEISTLAKSYKGVVALLPGSRQQELRIKLPLMLKACASFPEYLFVIAKAPSLDKSFYEQLFNSSGNVTLVENKTYALLSVADAALVTSGTATLETALFEVPQVICYKGGKISYMIARHLVKIRFIGLVNLIMDKEVVKELIQDDLTPENIICELKKILFDKEKIKQIKDDYQQLKNILNTGINASEKAAEIVYNTATL